MSNQALRDLKQRQKNKYNKLPGSIRCGILGLDVTLNAQGFEHIHMKTPKKFRSSKDAFSRLTLVPFIPDAIQNPIEVKKGKDRVDRKSGKDVKYYELTSLVGRRGDLKVVVMIRKVGNGNWHLYGIRKK